jgi:hypothetical protein
MKDFIKKTVIVLMASIIFSMIASPILQVGDNTYNQDGSKNYNGYFALVDEMQLIESGAFVYNQRSNGIYQYELDMTNIHITQEIMFTRPYHAIIYSDNLNGHYMIYAFQLQDYGTQMIILLNDGAYQVESLWYIAIFGVSNYGGV